MTGHPASPAQTSRFALAECMEGARRRPAQLSISFGGAVPGPLLREAWKAVASAHGVLRSAFRKAGASGLQRIEHDGAEASWRDLDWSEVPPEDIGARWTALQAEEVARPIDLHVAPVLRFVSITLPGGARHQLVTFPQFAIDEEAWFFFLCEWLEALEGRRPEKSRPGSPAAASGEEDTGWWRKVMESAKPGAFRFFGGTGEANEHRTLLGRDATASLVAACQAAGVTPRDAVLAAWGFLLARLDLSPYARLLASVEIPDAHPGEGGALNILPCHFPVNGKSTLAGMAKDVAAFEKARAKHSGMAFPEIPLPESFPAAPESFAGAFLWLPPSLNDRISEVFPRWINLDARLILQPVHPLELEVRDGPRLSLRLRSASLPAAETTRLLSWLEALLDAFVSAPETILEEIALPGTPTTADQDGGTTPQPAPIEAIIADAAAAHPDLHAVEDPGGAALTFREVDEYAGLLAAHLRGTDLGDGWMTAICLTPSPWVPVALLGVLRAGNTAMPLDPLAPADWLADKAAGADAELVVCDSSTLSVFEGTDKKLIVIDREWDSISSGTPAPAEAVKPPKVSVAFAGTPADAAPPLSSLAPSLLSSACTRTVQAAGFEAGSTLTLTAPAGTATYVAGILCAMAAGTTVRFAEENNWQIDSQSVWLSSTAFAAWMGILNRNGRDVPESLSCVVVDTRREPLSAVALATWFQRGGRERQLLGFHSPCDFPGIALRFEPEEDMLPVESIPEGRPKRGCGFRFADLDGQQPPFGYPGVASFHIPGTPAPCGRFVAYRDSSGSVYREKNQPVGFAIAEALRRVEGVFDAAWDSSGSGPAWYVGTLSESDPALSAAIDALAASLPHENWPGGFARVPDIVILHGLPDFPALERTARPKPALPTPKPTGQPAPLAEEEVPVPEPGEVAPPPTPISLDGDPEAPLLAIMARGASPASLHALAALLSDSWRVVCLPVAQGTDILEEAAAIRASLASAAPDGPLHLVGIGAAGLPTFEAARILRNEGRDVPYLVIAGCEPPKARRGGWLDKLKRGLGAAHTAARPLSGPCGVILTRDLTPDASSVWQDMAPDGIVEFIGSSTADLTGPQARDFAGLLEKFAG